jgi:hypothetical protein
MDIAEQQTTVSCIEKIILEKATISDYHSSSGYSDFSRNITDQKYN